MHQETLTAYKCRFKYRRRGNIKYNEQKELIKNNDKPHLSITEFLSKYAEVTSGFVVGKNSDRAIKILKDDIVDRGERSWYLKIRAGKQGRPFVTIDSQGDNFKIYDTNTAALYENNVYIYEKDDYFIAIFHRRNGSGCKSVFMETANDFLRKDGLILDMHLVVSPEDEYDGGIVTNIKLLQVRENISSDDADNIRSRSKRIIREIGLNLNEVENYGFLDIMHRFQKQEISKEEAFIMIREMIPGSDDYSDGEVIIKIQGRTRKIPWNQLENVIAVHDITSSLEGITRDSARYVQRIGELSDRYCKELERFCDEVDDE